jgi:propanol-preferring alcohol dehydrogenase
MKAAVVTAFNQPLEIQEVPIPKVSAGKVLVKVIATGVCHTDLHAMHGDWPIKPTVPFIPGHEGVGEVVEVGEGITHLKVGDKVGIPWLYSACGHCDHCYAGWETLCKKQQNSGYSVNGSFAEYCLADGDYVGVIPEGVDLFEIAPILCAGVTVYKGLKMTEAKTGDWVAISGIGGLGHVAIQYAKTIGFNVIAIDVDDSKLALAKELGADVGINALKVNVKEEVLKASGRVVMAYW